MKLGMPLFGMICHSPYAVLLLDISGRGTLTVVIYGFRETTKATICPWQNISIRKFLRHFSFNLANNSMFQQGSGGNRSYIKTYCQFFGSISRR